MLPLLTDPQERHFYCYMDYTDPVVGIFATGGDLTDISVLPVINATAFHYFAISTS